MYEEQLRVATRALPPMVALWTSRALRSGWFELGASAYEDGPGGGAKMAGIWADGGLLPGHPQWGTAGGPSASVEEFAAYFDLRADELSGVGALEIVQAELSRYVGEDMGRGLFPRRAA